MIIRLSLCGVQGGKIWIDLCKLLLFKNDIGKYRFVPNFRFPKIRFGPWRTTCNFNLNTLLKDSSLFNIFPYSNIWLILLRLEIYENLRF